MKHKRELIFVCSGSDCKKSGCKEIRMGLKESFRQGEYKGQFKLIQTKCLDMCKSAPVVIVGDHFCKKSTLSKVLHELKKS